MLQNALNRSKKKIVSLPTILIQMKNILIKLTHQIHLRFLKTHIHNEVFSFINQLICYAPFQKERM